MSENEPNETLSKLIEYLAQSKEFRGWMIDAFSMASANYLMKQVADGNMHLDKAIEITNIVNKIGRAWRDE